MKLNNAEFNAMNSPVRRFFQKNFEYNIFKKMGLDGRNKVILEIGCGSGYGAVLLSEYKPKKYIGIDIMPEQINLAKKRKLKNSNFHVLDATKLSIIEDNSIDMVVIFGILHHIPDWRKSLNEIHRVLRKGGKLYVEEPGKRFIRRWDRIFKWEHPHLFTITEFENYIKNGAGFNIIHRKKILELGAFCAEKRSNS